MLHTKIYRSIFSRRPAIHLYRDGELVSCCTKRPGAFNRQEGFESMWLEAVKYDSRLSTIIPNRLFSKGNHQLPAWLNWVHDYMHRHYNFYDWVDTEGNTHYGYSKHNRDWNLGDYRDRFEECWLTAQRNAEEEWELDDLDALRDNFDVFWGLKVASFNYEDACDWGWE